MQKQQREPAIFIVVGGMGTGKSVRTKEKIKQYVKAGRKVLVYDTNAPFERTYESIKTVAHKHVGKLQNIQARRVVPMHKNGKMFTLDEKVELLVKILNAYQSGCIVLEDINQYLLDPNKLEEVIGVIITVRHRGLDVIIHYQTLAAVPTRFRRVAQYYRMHYTVDSVDQHPDRVNNYEVFKLAELMINREYEAGNIYFYLYVDNLTVKIRGGEQAITDDQFRSACVTYLRMKQKIYRDILLQYDLGKPSLANFEQAVKIFFAQKKKRYLL